MATHIIVRKDILNILVPLMACSSTSHRKSVDKLFALGESHLYMGEQVQISTGENTARLKMIARA